MNRLILLVFLPALPCEAVDESAIRAAVAKSLPLIERSSIIAIDERPNCFTCHHAGLPVMTFLAARDRGFPINAQNLQTQIQFTADFLAKGRQNYLQGKGQGGQAFTAGSALWTLKLGGWKADPSTEAVIEYLLGHQKDRGHWAPPSIRPPSEESPFSTTFVVLEGLNHYASKSQRERAEARLVAAREWALQSPAKSTEDRVFRLWALFAANAGKDAIQSAARDLLATQHENGGWSQLPDLSPDAYATGTALTALLRTASVTTRDSACQRGLQWLLNVQLPDGSWHVVTRSEPIQSYFESGYPHGPDQFISITAACWATTALTLALPAKLGSNVDPL